MSRKLSTWFKGLSKGGKLALLCGAGLGVVSLATVSAKEPVITTRTETKTVAIPFETTYQDDDALLSSETLVMTPGVEGSKVITYRVTYRDGHEDKREVQKEETTKQPVNQLTKRGTKEITTTEVTEPIAFGATTINDSSMDKGASKVSVVGMNGSKLVTYEVTKVKGAEISRKAVKETVTKPPVDQVTSIGTKVKAPVSAGKNCDPNYSGKCVPIASDVDCGGGSGNGPAYVYGTVRVIGVDIYDLDRDGDGYGCD